MLYSLLLIALLTLLTFALIGFGEVHFGVSRLLEDIERERRATLRSGKKL